MTPDPASVCQPDYKLLDEEQINALHDATIELLSTIGVQVRHQAALTMLEKAGCRIENDQTVFIPRQIVESAIESAPSSVAIYNRQGEGAMHLTGRRIHFGPGTDLLKTYDLDSGDLRESTLQDVINTARVCDALEEIDFVASYALPGDVPTNLSAVESFRALLENTVKPVFFTAHGREDLAFIHEMAAAAVGGFEALKEKPILVHYSEPLSPRIHSQGAVDKLLYCAEKQIPVNYSPGMMSGASAPATIAGAIVQGNAEALSGLVMHQLKNKGAPIISGFGMSTMDMRTFACVYACPEYRLAITACADLYHYYGLPMWGTAGVTDSHDLDQQAGMEWGISLLVNAMAGANLIHDVGYMGQGLIGRPEALVICAEIISFVKRFQRGFTIDDEHLGLEAIKQAGAKGHFLAVPHTKKHYKSEHWRPGLSNRDSIETWEALGKPSMSDKAAAKAKEILKNHTPPPLADEVQVKIDKICQRARKGLEDKDFVN